jgi:16S rRNA (uracil1498-N3)-methyltransferase
MQQYFIENISNKILFNDEQAHHIKNVMRMKENEIVKVVDEEENAALVTIHYESKLVYGLLKEMILDDFNSNIQIYLGMALIKKDKWEFCIQKACETGAYEILPFVSSRCVVKISDEKNDKKIDRWQKIASEACEQSKQNHLCMINDILTYDEICKLDFDLKLIAYENADKIANNLASVCVQHKDAKKILVLIGPEGGFSESEVTKALSNGFICVSLGKSILRAETAAISAINMLTYHYDILGDKYGIIEKVD